MTRFTLARHVQFIPGIVPRICMGWSTIQIPTGKGAGSSSAQGANAFNARDGRARVPARSGSRSRATGAIPGPGRTISRRGSQSTTGPQQATAHSGAPRNVQPRSAANRCAAEESASIAGQEVKAVMRQPHAETQGDQGVRIARRHLEPAHRETAPPPAQNGRAADCQQAAARRARRGKTGWSPTAASAAPGSVLSRLCHADHGTDHPRGVGEGAEHQDHDQGRQVRAFAERADAGAMGVVPEVAAGQTASMPILSWGRRGRSRGRTCSPCCPPCAAGTGAVRSRECRRVPRMQSLVRHDCADLRVADLDFQRRHQRLHEVELADRDRHICRTRRRGRSRR